MIPEPSLACVGLILVNFCWPVTLKPVASDAATFCQIAKPLRWSHKDTPDTIAMLDRHNAKGKALCGWK